MQAGPTRDPEHRADDHAEQDAEKPDHGRSETQVVRPGVQGVHEPRNARYERLPAAHPKKIPGVHSCAGCAQKYAESIFPITP